MGKVNSSISLMLIFAIVFCCGIGPAYSCSTFVLQDEENLLFGRNFDFFTSKGLVVINKRDVAKTALLATAETPVSWVSKYGSITFNQIGVEFPFGGINEKGLVVEMMSLPETGYPQPDNRPALMELQWIQYQLDNCSTVEEVIQSDNDIRISPGNNPPLQHYLICDASGRVAAIEFIDGKLVCHTGDSLPVPVLTNSTYDESLEFHRAFDSLDILQKFIRTSLDSRDRFSEIGRRLLDYKSENIKPALDYAFDILAAVSTGQNNRHCTAWTIVYDVNNLRIYFKTFENRNIRVIDLADFEFGCATPVMVLDMRQDLKGDISGYFTEYTPEINRDMVFSVMAIYNEVGFMEEVPPMAMEFLANYPATVGCKQANIE